ncbi:E3 ubiquitin-protein ligase SlrP [Salmonella enterica]|uniref:RING-type E3 ubiquitin transferase n=1 Tax=Salmonella enterica TaxID=28901 RepID=A0A379Q9B5_SALER|nr:type III secretion system effector E3 ubiquitin transferase SlrP [Salmonella enterica subsp. salamae serovar Springs]SUF38653.1 E3 ubiquitin-protein ligase SlrP [Salmonella enterica]HCM1985366.1 SPI-1 type III secretion system effector E3 ubiquitin transferase SlrP [Salmonella enterica subsp. salamae serovar 40:a:z39]
MFNITNIQSTARHQSISNEASTEVPLKEEIWNKMRTFFSSEHQVEAQSCIAYLCHPPETASPEEIKSKFECLRGLAFPAYADNIQSNRGGADQHCILNENSQEILSIIFNTDGYIVEGGGKSVTYTRVTESEQASSASGSKDAVNYELIWSEWAKEAPPKEAQGREKAVQRMRDCLKNNQTELRLKILGLTTIPAYIPEQITTLILDHNELKSLPENLQGNIQTLFARSNQLTSIPATLPDTIQKMDLSINFITELPGRLPSALQSLDLFHNKISCLPENLPEELLYLSVYDNSVSTLPEHLPSGITHLNVQSNSLTALPETLPPGLKTLEAGENALTSLPETLPSTLQNLDVSHNHLINLPENLPAALQVMQASRNHLVRLPESLPHFRGEGPRPARIIVEYNPFSERTIQNMQRLMSSVDYQGPQVFFAMGDFSIVRVTRPLHEAVKGWLTCLEEEDVNKWRAFEAEANAAAFSGFLDYLGDTQNTRHPDFKEQVSAWLMRLAGDSALRETAFIIAMDATISCEDRVTLTYHQMQEATLVHDAERGAFDSQLAELIMAGREIFRLEQVESLAREKVKRLFFIDEIEVYLGFQNQLRESLSLTTMTQEMRFYNVSGITESDLDEAEIRIKIAENSDFHKWFALWGPWHKVLERIAPEEWREMMDKRAECIETEEYQRRVNAELEALGIAGDPDAERMTGMRIMEEINQTLFTESMENVLMKKGVSSLMSAYWR